jgi:Rieske Fe-S protein
MTMTTAMDSIKAATPMTTTARETAGFDASSAIPVAISASEQTQLAVVIWRGERNVATRGARTMTRGIVMKNGDAGTDDGPSHHIGRPIVRLEIATASNAPNTPAHVMVETVRQPSLGSTSIGVGGESKSILATVLSQPLREVTPMDSLHAYGKVAIQ